MTQSNAKRSGRTTVRLPKALHKEIQRESIETERDMNDIMVEQLASRYPEKRGLFLAYIRK